MSAQRPVLTYLLYITPSGRWALRKHVDQCITTYEVLRFMSGSYTAREFADEKLARAYIEEQENGPKTNI